jgi:hypothetical protein
MRQSTSIHQQIDHKIRIEGSRRSNVLKPGCTKSAGEPILDAHFHPLFVNPYRPQFSIHQKMQNSLDSFHETVRGLIRQLYFD